MASKPGGQIYAPRFFGILGALFFNLSSFLRHKYADTPRKIFLFTPLIIPFLIRHYAGKRKFLRNIVDYPKKIL